MSEPSSAASAASAMAGVGLAMYLPGIDGNALLGGFGGAIFFVVFARDYNALTRLGYLLVSWVGGYYAGIEALGRGLTQTSGMAAFVAATLCVTGGIGMLEWMRGGEIPNWMRGLLRRRGGSPMVDPLSTLTVLVCSAICMRLITYRRAGARFRPGVSLCAYLLALCTGCQALGILAGLYRAEHLSPWMLGVLLVLLVLLLQARGNLARVLRLY